MQHVLGPPLCVLHQLLHDYAVGDHVRSLTEVEVDHMHSSPLIHQASQQIVEGCQVGSA